MPMVRGLDSIFHGLADTYRQTEYRQPGDRDAAQGQGMGAGQNRERSPGRGPRVFRSTFDMDLNTRSEGSMGSEFHTAGGLHPRDADGPQPMATPLRTLGEYVPLLKPGSCQTGSDFHSILALFRADFGSQGQPGGGGVRVMTGPNPLAILSTLLNMDRHGDTVYSQEELDRVISQLIDQNARGTAPPPAAPNAIESLPKKNVDKEMLGTEGKAECSICMEPVELGTEVTVLPCKHWFHYNCIEMWLSQHNTCPHCRRGIDAPAQ
jgi:hypothetical protein